MYYNYTYKVNFLRFNMFHYKNTSRNGFTLIEVLFVIVILGIISAIAIPRLNTTSLSAKEAANARNISIIQKQVERWHVEKGSFPANIDEIGDDPEYFPSGLPANPFGEDDDHFYYLDENNVVIFAEEV